MALASAAGALWLSYVHLWGWQRGHVHRGYLERWANEVGDPLTWTGYLHPPLSSLLLAGVDGAARLLGTDQGLLIHAMTGPLTAIQVGLLYAWLTARHSIRWAAFGAGLGAILPSTLRPFEHYPVAGTLLLLALVAMDHAADRTAATPAPTAHDLAGSAGASNPSVPPTQLVAAGVRAGPRGGPESPERGSQQAGAALVLAAALALAAVETHLLAGFALVPAFFASVPRDQRRRWAVAGGAVVAIFLLSAWPAAFTILATGPGPREHRGGPSLEWTPAALVVGAVASAVVGRSGRGGQALPVGSVAVVAAVLLLQATQLADGQPWPASLSYLSLVDMALVATTVGGLATLARRHPRAAAILAVALTGFMVRAFARGLDVLWIDDGAFLTLVQPWAWW